MTTHAPRSQIPVLNNPPASPSAAGFPALSPASVPSSSNSSNIPSYARATKASLPPSPSPTPAASTGPSAREKKVSPLSAPNSPYARPAVVKPKKVVAKGVVPGAAPTPKLVGVKKTPSTTKAPMKKVSNNSTAPARKADPATKTSSLSALAPSFTFNQPLPTPSTSSIARDHSQSPPLEFLSPHAPAFEPTSSAPASPPLLDETPPIGVTEQSDSPPPSRTDDAPNSTTTNTGLGIEDVSVEEIKLPTPTFKELQLDAEDSLEEGETPEEKEHVSDSTVTESSEVVEEADTETEAETEVHVGLKQEEEVVPPVVEEAANFLEKMSEPAGAPVMELATVSNSEEKQVEVNSASVTPTDRVTDVEEEVTRHEEAAPTEVAQSDETRASSNSALVTTTEGPIARSSVRNVDLPDTLEEALASLPIVATAVTPEADSLSAVENVENVEIPTTAEEVAQLPSLDDSLDVEATGLVLAEDASEAIEGSGTELPVNVQEEREVVAEKDLVVTNAEEGTVEVKSPEWMPFEDPVAEPSHLQSASAQTSSSNDQAPTDADTSPSTPKPTASMSDPNASSSTPFTSQINKSLAESTPSNSKPALRRRRSSSPPRPTNEHSKDADEAPSLTLAIRSAWHATTWSQRIPAIIASVAINFGLPFINGVMLGFGELFARNFIGAKLGWGAPFPAPSASNTGRANTASVGLRHTSGPLAPGEKGSAGGRTAAGFAFRELEEGL